MYYVLIQIFRFNTLEFGSANRFYTSKATTEKTDKDSYSIYLFVFWNNDKFTEISSTCFASDMHYKSSRK